MWSVQYISFYSALKLIYKVHDYVINEVFIYFNRDTVNSF